MKKIQKVWGLIYCTIACNLVAFLGIALVIGEIIFISNSQYESLQEYKKSVAINCEIE